MATARSSSARWRLGLGFVVDTGQGRERHPRESREGLAAHLILARGGSGGTASSSRGGGATARVGGTEVGGDRDAFARSPLPISLVFAGMSFSLLFSVFFYLFSVIDLFGQANELQKW